jgi:hypothetical protein
LLIETISVTGFSFSVTSGGFICMAILGILAIFMVKFRKYEVQTNDFAIAQRLKREKATSEGEFPEN